MSLAMLEEARKEGVEEAILTFHFYPEEPDQLERAKDAFEKLNIALGRPADAASSEGSAESAGGEKLEALKNPTQQLQASQQVAADISKAPRLQLGNEILFDSRSLEHVQSGRALTLADSRYVLLEFMPSDPYEKLEKAVRSFRMAGYRPVLAHVERYSALRLDEIMPIKQLIEGGAIIQVNARNFDTGRFDLAGSKKQKKLIHLIELGLVHVIADDSHNLDERKPCMGTVMDKLRSKGLDEKTINRIFYENPRKILRNESI